MEGDSMESIPFEPVPMHDGKTCPPIIFGTSGIVSVELIKHALHVGHRAFDTAAQYHHYDETILGEAIKWAQQAKLNGGLGLNRADLFIQTKFTTPDGHLDGCAPYVLEDSIEVMVSKSVESSLHRLDVRYIDSLLLHAPMPTPKDTLKALRCMESFFPLKVHSIGISNVTPDILEYILHNSNGCIWTVQNRCALGNSFDSDIRQICINNDILYQAISVVRLNKPLIECQLIQWLASQLSVSAEQVLIILMLSNAKPEERFTIISGSKTQKTISENAEAIKRIGMAPGFVREAFASLILQL